ncbi:MAG: hypothetical protein GY804_09735 [Alphaproteobacteria bacterium]|nr:hypothetical protein [Alphaproteobacteria bacterium]
MTQTNQKERLKNEQGVSKIMIKMIMRIVLLNSFLLLFIGCGATKETYKEETYKKYDMVMKTRVDSIRADTTYTTTWWEDK